MTAGPAGAAGSKTSKAAKPVALPPTGKRPPAPAADVPDAAVHKLHLALTADGGGGASNGGIAGGEGMALAVADGYKPSPYLQEVMQVLEDTKVGWGCLRFPVFVVVVVVVVVVVMVVVVMVTVMVVCGEGGVSAAVV